MNVYDVVNNRIMELLQQSVIQGWLKALKNDKTLLVHAATQAQRSTDYILNVTHTSEDWLVV